jgi:hypothetical protein
MTKARIAALEWFHDRGEVNLFGMDAPSHKMREMMISDGQLEKVNHGNFRLIGFRLTDKGRQDLHEATQ